MKKIIMLAVSAAFLGLVGCSTSHVQDKPDAMSYKESMSQRHSDAHKHKKNCHKGKMGVEKVEKDTAK